MKGFDKLTADQHFPMPEALVLESIPPVPDAIRISLWDYFVVWIMVREVRKKHFFANRVWRGMTMLEVPGEYMYLARVQPGQVQRQTFYRACEMLNDVLELAPAKGWRAKWQHARAVMWGLHSWFYPKPYMFTPRDIPKRSPGY